MSISSQRQRLASGAAAGCGCLRREEAPAPQVPRGVDGRTADGRAQAHGGGGRRGAVLVHEQGGHARPLRGASPGPGERAVGGGGHGRRRALRGREQHRVRVGEGAPGN